MSLDASHIREGWSVYGGPLGIEAVVEVGLIQHGSSYGPHENPKRKGYVEEG